MHCLRCYATLLDHVVALFAGGVYVVLSCLVLSCLEWIVVLCCVCVLLVVLLVGYWLLVAGVAYTFGRCIDFFSCMLDFSMYVEFFRLR